MINYMNNHIRWISYLLFLSFIFIIIFLVTLGLQLCKTKQLNVRIFDQKCAGIFWNVLEYPCIYVLKCPGNLLIVNCFAKSGLLQNLFFLNIMGICCSG